ncbi:MAG TPA: signal peptide peptidase SppA [Rudaea sp.]|nr:signal peptide peptidase SppA [Rudaea sp.]
MADQKKRGWFIGFFVGLWALINFARLLVVNIIFIIIVVLVVIAMRSSAPSIEDHTALVLDPKGSIVEQYTADAAQRAFSSVVGGKVREVQLRDILRAIDAATHDAHIERIVIEPDNIEGAGLSTLREIGTALDRFKAAGKEIIAVSNGMSQGQYYLAAHANRILLHPGSEEGVLLVGFSAYRSYFKQALDWLGVDVHLFRVGEFKSFAEPYIRDDESPEAREADLFWMNDVWNDYLKDIAAQRHLDPAQLTAQIADFANVVKSNGGDMAKVALETKLVDELVTKDQADAALAAKGAAEDHSYRKVGFLEYSNVVERQMALDTRPEIGVIVAEGEILGGDQPPGTIGGDSTAQLVRQAREDSSIKAVVLRVNSPGGDAFASELIRREIELTKAAGKPVVVSMGDVAASGGYWISMNGDEIYAQPTTITGSIGIFGLFFTIPNTLAKIGVHTDGVGTTPLAGALDPRRPLDPKVGETIQALINKGYQDFIGNVAAARHKTKEDIDAIARGRVWSGDQALERGLVDKMGGLEEAAAAAAQRAKLGNDYRLHYIEKPISTWERFLLSLHDDDTATARFVHSILPEMPVGLLAQPEVRDQIRLLQSMQGKHFGVFSYCFCDLH